MDIVEENADEDANIIFGTTTSEDIPIDEVKLTIIATGFEDPSDIEVSSRAEEPKVSPNVGHHQHSPHHHHMQQLLNNHQ